MSLLIAKRVALFLTTLMTFLYASIFTSILSVLCECPGSVGGEMDWDWEGFTVTLYCYR